MTAKYKKKNKEMLQRKAHKNNKNHSEEDNIKESFL